MASRIDQPLDQLLEERLSPIIAPIFQDFSRSLVRAIEPALRESQERIAQVIAEQVEQALPLVRRELRPEAHRDVAETTSHPREGDTGQPPPNDVPGSIEVNLGGDRPPARDGSVGPYDEYLATRPQSTNLADLLERVLDKGIVIAGDITLSLLALELLTLKIRLLIASVDKAQQIGIDWWRSDPALSSQAKRQQLEDRIERLEARLGEERDQRRGRLDGLEARLMEQAQPADRAQPDESPADEARNVQEG